MKISRNWLQSYVDLASVADEEISRAITFLGFEVEGVLHTGAPRLSSVFVGEVLTRDKHPNADKLSICTVDVGPQHGIKTIVCGAQNYKVGDRVPVALPGAVLPGDFEIKQSKIRGQSSDGMMCSGRELGVGEDDAGLLILADRPALGLPINEVLPAGDVVFDIEITPNRPDCLCHLGIARELAAWFKRELRYPDIKFTANVVSPTTDAGELLNGVRVDAPEDCPLYTAYSIAGVKIGPSPAWLQDRLRAVGLRPINNVVDVGNYVLHEYGQPVHTFDAAKLGGRQIVVRRAVEGEKIVTLDNKERTLSASMLVIADAQRPVVIAGIMGGEDSGVAPETTDLVLEVAVFRRQSVRATGRRLGLSSDSSYRYERGVDPHTLPEAAHRTLDLILETAGGRVVGKVHRVGSDVPWKREIVLRPDFVNERLGFTLPAEEMKASLEALELTVTREEVLAETQAVQWTVGVPSWRDDLDRPIDLVEEILRLHGTDKIPAKGVTAPGLVGDDDPVVRYNRAAMGYLVGHDFHECVNYTLRSQKEQLAAGAGAHVGHLALSNPFVEDQSHLRCSLIGGLLESLKLNQARGVVVSRLAEVGRIFLESGGQLWECAAVGFVIAEPVGERAWLRREPADFYSVKHHIEVLASLAGIDFGRQPLTPISSTDAGWQTGHASGAGKLIHGWTASFGLLGLSAVKALGIDGKVYAGLLAVLPEKLSTDAPRRRYRPFSLFPPALRDLAIVVDAATPADEVRKTLAKLARAALGNAFQLETVQVFDVYQGQGLPEGSKSLAFSLVFRAEDRTLTDDEVNAVFQKLQNALASQPGYSLRK